MAPLLGAFDDATDLVEEEVVVFGAAQEAGIFEFVPRHATVGAARNGGIGNLGVGFEELVEKFVNRDMCLVDIAGLLKR